MKVLVLSQYFWPENFVINDIVRLLKKQGHDVVVATGKPNYPDGNVFEGYRAAGIQRESFEESVEVLRVPLYPRGKGGAKKLALNYCSFVVTGLLFLPWMLRGRKFDAILVFAPSPITQAIPAIPLKWIKKACLALWIQDLWPESLSATGFVRNRNLLKGVGWMVKAIYQSCDLLLVQSHAFIEPVARYTKRHKIHYYPNSIDICRAASNFSLGHELEELFQKHFCVVFAGNLGTAQGLETVLEAAVLLRNDPDIRIVLVGSGSRLSWLKSQQKAQGLDNLVLLGRFPVDAMPQIFERSSALLVSLSDEKAFAQTIPSKIQAYLAAGRPIIACMNGEGSRVVCEAGAGLVSPAEQALPLVSNIRTMKAMTAEERDVMARAGRKYFEAHFEMNSQVTRLVELLKR